MRTLVLALLAGCSGSKDTTGGSTGPGDTGTGSTGTTGSTSGDELFVDVSGTWDGAPIHVACDESAQPWEFYATQQSDGSGTFALGGACLLSDAADPVVFEVAFTGSGPEDTTACAFDGSNVGIYTFGELLGWNCLLDGSDRYHVDLDELTVEGDGSVVWGGTLDVAGTGVKSADLTGSFRFSSPAPPY